MSFESDLFRLRPVRPGDAPALQRCFDDPAFVRFLNPQEFPLPFERADAERFVAEQLARDPANGLDWAIDVDGEFAGMAHLFPSGEDRTQEIALLLGPSASGRRVGSALMPRLIAYAFEKLGARRVVATAHRDNVASRRVMEKSGMRLDRIEEEGRVGRSGRRASQVHYSIESR